MAKTRQFGLGRGLETLMGSNISVESDVLTEIDINLIDPNPNQPRRSFDEASLDELAASIISVGIISPILVTKIDGRYMIISGERRFRAARKAKLSHIPAIIRDYDIMKQMEVALIENLQRADLNPVDEARGIRALMDECALTQEQTAVRLGKSRSAIANTLRLLALDEEILALLQEGKLSEGHGRALLAIDDPSLQSALAKAIIEKKLSVRQAEEQAKLLKAKPLSDKKEAPRSEELDVMESAIKRVLGTSVSVSGTPKSGKISIKYKSFEEFERIYNILSSLQ